MPLKFKINLLFFCLYFGSIGKYIVSEIIDLKSADTVITLIVDFLIFIIALSFVQLKLRSLKYLYILIFISSISYMVSDNHSVISHVNGLRETLIFVCYFIIFEVLYNSSHLKNVNDRFITFSYIFLAIQIPVTILQFMRFGPGDSVVGTLGLGGSGMLTLSIFLLIFYLIENKIKNPKERLKKGIPLLIFLIPIALNETKISFILFLSFFLSLINFKKIGSSIVIIVFGILSVISFSYVYTTQESFNHTNSLEGIFNSDFLDYYLVGNDNPDDYEDIPRFTKLIVGTNKLVNDGDLLLGKDYSAFMWGETMMKSEFAIKYKWLLQGSRPYSFYLLISGGVLLLLLILWMILSEFFRKNSNEMRNYSSPLLFFLIAIFFIILFYNDSPRSSVFSFFFVYLLFFARQFKKPMRLIKLKNI